MNYTKPAITSIDEAKSAIQGTPKKLGPPDHVPQEFTIATVGAYEADE